MRGQNNKLEGEKDEKQRPRRQTLCAKLEYPMLLRTVGPALQTAVPTQRCPACGMVVVSDDVVFWSARDQFWVKEISVQGVLVLEALDRAVE